MTEPNAPAVPAPDAHPADRLRARLAEPRLLVAPGVYDALSALLAERSGAESVYLSGASIAYTRLGRPDIGLTTFTEVGDTLARITERVPLPVIVDGDTGFGNALNVQRTVRGFERAGAAMVQIEDQGFPKRCGHLDGKTVVPQAEMVGKLKAALDARDRMLVMARTDAVAVEGLDAALDRAEAYLETGVDALFVEALRDEAQIAAACARFAHRVPLLVNLVEGGRTPMRPAVELERLGFRLAIFPGGAVRALAHALAGFYGSIASTGSTEGWRDRMLDFDGLNALLGTPQLLAQGRHYAD